MLEELATADSCSMIGLNSVVGSDVGVSSQRNWPIQERSNLLFGTTAITATITSTATAIITMTLTHSITLEPTTITTTIDGATTRAITNKDANTIAT